MNRFSVIYHHEPYLWRSDDACEKWKKGSERNQGGVCPTNWRVMHSAHAVIDQ